MSIDQEYGRLGADVVRVFGGIGAGAGVSTYHFRRRVPSADITPATGQRGKTTTDYEITGACVPLQHTQGQGSGVGGAAGRPSEDRVFDLGVAAMRTAGYAAEIPTNQDAIVENKTLVTERRWEIVRAELIGGGSLWRVVCRQPRGTGYPS